MPPIVPEPSVKMDLEAARKVREEVGDDIVLLMVLSFELYKG